MALQQAAYERQQREIAHLQHFIDRFRAKATKARQAQSRVKALARMERVALAHAESAFEFAFPEPRRLPNPLLVLEDIDVGYGAAPILIGVNLTVGPGTRLGLLGANGAGKSTLIKVLAGQIQPLAGTRMEGQGLAIGYFAQHQLEQLRPEWTPIEHLQSQDSRAKEQELRNFLGGFGFDGESQLARVAPFSGGEKARLVLALLVWQRPNLLLLDEPTNHLDLEMRHALAVALQEYVGAMIVVSHDRHLLRTTTDAFVHVADGRVAEFPGDLDDYRSWFNERQRADQSGDAKLSSRAVGGRRERKRQKAEQRQALAAARRPVEQRSLALERTIERLSAERLALDDLLSEPGIYQEDNKDRLRDVLLRQADMNREWEQAEAEWMSLQDDLERLATGGSRSK
jgi:ATP-binding cassette subfamily F protein 3